MGSSRAVSLVLAAILIAATARAAPTIEDILRAAGLDVGAKDKVLAGEIVSKELAEGSDKELAAGLVVLIRAPLAKTMQAIREHKTIEANRDILAFGTDLAKLGYSADEAGEAFAFLNASPGSKFNLSAHEFDRVRALEARLKSDPRKDPAALEAVNSEYRAILADRLAAYQKGGAKAVAPYSRGKNEAKPSDELALAVIETVNVKLFPEFHEALAGYPFAPREGIEEEFLWFKQRIEKRPVLILAHRMYQRTPQYGLMMERQIYVGASYNSSQTIAGGVEQGGNLIALYANRCFTDQVAGSMSGMKHRLGRGQMIGELKALFENIRKTLER